MINRIMDAGDNGRKQHIGMLTELQGRIERITHTGEGKSSTFIPQGHLRSKTPTQWLITPSVPVIV